MNGHPGLPGASFEDARVERDVLFSGTGGDGRDGPRDTIIAWPVRPTAYSSIAQAPAPNRAPIQGDPPRSA